MSQKSNKQSQNTQKAGLSASVLEYIELFVFAITALILLFSLGLRTCVVDGPSMNNTLQDGERLITSNLFYRPKTGDIIVFHQTSDALDTYNEPIVKRVIATGGQYVKIDYQNNLIYVSDDENFEESEILDESAYAYFANPDGKWREAQNGVAPEEWAVPEGYLFVLGDNRNNSADSRYFAVGLVDARRVLGKVILRITPFSAFGRVS